MKGLEPLKFVLLGKLYNEILYKLEPWLRSWWGETLTTLESMGCFEEEQIVDNLLCIP